MRPSPFIIALFMALLAVICFAVPSTKAAQIYSQDPTHLWNRLYDATMVRTNAGITYDDLLEPPYWYRTKYLLQGEPNRRAIQLLTEFSADRNLSGRMSDQQKAIMQRDLLGIFTWAISKQNREKDSGNLAKALARAIHHIALDKASIKRLPDNYAAAVRTGKYASAFDPSRPDKPFLPHDLMDTNSAWLSLTAVDNDMLPATMHFDAFQGRSAFSVLFRHPDGRKAGEEYLHRLNQLTNRLGTVLDEELVRERRTPTEQFPPNTIWALVRHAILVDRDSKPVISPVVESVQMRVYLSTSRYPMQYQDRDGTLQYSGKPSQIFLEWQLNRKSLFSQGGFHLAQPGEDYWPVLMGKGFDPFENEGWNFRPPKPPLTLSCYTCHGQSGIHSVNSRSRFFENPSAPPVELQVADLAQLARNTEFKSGRMANWQLLRWIVAEQSGAEPNDL